MIFFPAERITGQGNRLAMNAERLDKTDGHIAKCKARITLQHGVIKRLKTDGHDIEPAERLLRNLVEPHDLFFRYWLVLLDGSDRRALNRA